MKILLSLLLLVSPLILSAIIVCAKSDTATTILEVWDRQAEHERKHKHQTSQNDDKDKGFDHYFTGAGGATHSLQYDGFPPPLMFKDDLLLSEKSSSDLILKEFTYHNRTVVTRKLDSDPSTCARNNDDFVKVDLQLSSIDNPETCTIGETSCILNQDLDHLTVKWEKLIKSSDDAPHAGRAWIGIYSPPNSPNVNYVDYIYIDKYPKNEFTFRLMNLPESNGYEARYFSGGYACVTKSIPIQFKLEDREALRPRINFAGRYPNDRAVWITWSSGTNYDYSSESNLNHDDQPFVIYSYFDKQKNKQITKKAVQVTSSTTYKASDMCMSPANETGPSRYRSVGWIHSVLIDDVELLRAADSESSNTKVTVTYVLGQGVITTPRNRTLIIPSNNKSKNTENEEWSLIAYADHGAATLLNNPPFLDNEVGSHMPGSWLFDKEMRRLLYTHKTQCFDGPRAAHQNTVFYAYRMAQIR